MTKGQGWLRRLRRVASGTRQARTQLAGKPPPVATAAELKDTAPPPDAERAPADEVAEPAPAAAAPARAEAAPAPVSAISWRWIAGTATAAIIIVVLIVPSLPGRLTGNGIEAVRGIGQAVAGLGAQAKRIAITVQSPSVQTRERLINDRFEQAAWAEKLLKDTMGWSPPNSSRSV